MRPAHRERSAEPSDRPFTPRSRRQPGSRSLPESRPADGCGRALERGRELGRGERQRVERDARAARSRSAASVETGSQTPSASSSLGALAEHLPRRPVDHDVAVGVEHDDPVDDVDRRVEVVLDEHDGVVALAREFAQHRVDLVDAGGVEVGRGLVEHEHRAAHRQGAGDGEALPPAARQPVGVLVAPLPQAHELQRALGARQHLVDRHQLVLGTERHLVEQRAGDDLGIGVLEHHRDVLAQHAHAVVAAVEPRDAHRALELGGHGMRHEPVERERERRLAAPRRAEQQHDLARRDRQGHAVGRRPRRTLVADAHVVEFEQRGIGQGRPGSWVGGRPATRHPFLGQPNPPRSVAVRAQPTGDSSLSDATIDAASSSASITPNVSYPRMLAANASARSR